MYKTLKNIASTISAASSVANLTTAAVGIYAYGYALGRSELRQELISDIQELVPKALSLLPATGTKFHSFEGPLTESEAYYDVSLEKAAMPPQLVKGDDIREIRIGISSFEWDGAGTNRRAKRVSRPVFTVAMRDGIVVGVRTDGFKYAVPVELHKLDIGTLKKAKAMLKAFVSGRVALKKGHPMLPDIK